MNFLNFYLIYANLRTDATTTNSLRLYILLYVRHLYSTITINIKNKDRHKVSHKDFNSVFKRFFSNLISYYALITKFCKCRLLLIKFNCINIDRLRQYWDDSIIIRWVLFLFHIYHLYLFVQKTQYNFLPFFKQVFLRKC